MRLIDDDVLLDAICGCFNIMEAQGIDVTVARTIAKGIIDAAPAVDAAPVVHGRWTDKGSLSCRCSRCGCKSNNEYKYCPNCGAKMDGGEEDAGQ